MGETHYKLIYAGDIVPGFERDDVWNNLQALLSADNTTMDQLFSGQLVVLRKNLTTDQIRPYKQAMENAGAVCRVLPVDNEPPAEDNIQSQPPQASACRLLSRLSRVRFIAQLWAVALLALAGWYLPESIMPQLSQHVPGLELWHLVTGLLSLAGALMLIASIRRLHDINIKGWISLLLFVPGVNCLLLLWLLFAPGSADSNRFGPQPRAAGVIAQLLGLWLPLLAIIAAGTYGALNYEEMLQLGLELLDMIDWPEYMPSSADM